MRILVAVLLLCITTGAIAGNNLYLHRLQHDVDQASVKADKIIDLLFRLEKHIAHMESRISNIERSQRGQQKSSATHDELWREIAAQITTAVLVAAIFGIWQAAKWYMRQNPNA